MSVRIQNKSDTRHFSDLENAAKIVPHCNPTKQNSYWLMEELSEYQKYYIHPDTDDYPILLEAKLKKNGEEQIERFIFSNIDPAIRYIADAGLTQHRLSIVSKKLNMPTIIEVSVYYIDGVVTYLYRLEDETLFKESFLHPDDDLDESLFCIYSVPNGKPYKHIPYE